MDTQVNICPEQNLNDGCISECGAPRKLSEAELSEAVRGKILKYLSSGSLLALSVFLIVTTVFCAMSAIGMLFVLALPAQASEGITVSTVVSCIVASVGNIFIGVISAVVAGALCKIRRKAKKEGAVAVDSLTALAGTFSAFRLYYYINAVLSVALVIWNFFDMSKQLGYNGLGELDPAFAVGYIVGVCGYMAIATSVGVIVAHILSSSLIKLVNRIKERTATPLIPTPTKHRAAAVISFIYAGYMVLSIVAAILIYTILGIFIGAVGSMGMADMAGISMDMFTVILIIALVIIAAVLIAMLVPYIALSILMGVTVLRYNRLEKEMAALVADNCPEQTAQIQ